MSLAPFEPLDGLVQLLRVESSRFALYSELSSDHRRWDIHITLEGEGRWWMGSWVEGDVRALVGSRATENDIAALARDARSLITQCDLYISGWVPGLARGAGVLQLILGPDGDKPLHIPLDELSAEDAATHATSIIIAIASRAEPTARSIFPPTPAPMLTPRSYVTDDTIPRSSGRASSLLRPGSPTPSNVLTELDSPTRVGRLPKPASSSTRAKHLPSDEDSVEELVPNVKPRSSASPKKRPARKDLTPRRPPSGASLVNPNKRARRVVSLEFEDSQ